MHRSREAGRILMDNHLSRPGDCGRYPRRQHLPFHYQQCLSRNTSRRTLIQSGIATNLCEAILAAAFIAVEFFRRKK
jgi:hypothetical protein